MRDMELLAKNEVFARDEISATNDGVGAEKEVFARGDDAGAEEEVFARVDGVEAENEVFATNKDILAETADVDLDEDETEITSYERIENWLSQFPQKYRHGVRSLECEIIKQIVKVRKAKGITQRQLSISTGITQADISRIERGVRNPSIAVIEKLVKGLGMRLKVELIEDAEDYTQEPTSLHTTPAAR